LVEALAVLEDGSSPSQLAAAVSSDAATIAPALERLITLALVWGEDELSLIRPLREGLRTPAGLAAPSPEDPSAEEARLRVDRARREHPEALEALAWGPAAVTGHGRLSRELQAAGILVADGETRHPPRSIHLAVREGGVRRGHAAQRPAPTRPERTERSPGSRTAQAVAHAFEALRLLRTVRSLVQGPAGVLRRGGLP